MFGEFAEANADKQACQVPTNRPPLRLGFSQTADHRVGHRLHPLETEIEACAARCSEGIELSKAGRRDFDDDAGETFDQPYRQFLEARMEAVAIAEVRREAGSAARANQWPRAGVIFPNTEIGSETRPAMSGTGSDNKIDAVGAERCLEVYYDGGCPLCRSEIAHYRKLDTAGRVDFVDISSPAAETGPDLERKTALSRFHVRGRDGELESGAAAFVRLWRELPGWRWLAMTARVPGVVWLMERAYRGFLPLRPRLARYLSGAR